MKLRILLADDHILFRQAIRMTLLTFPDVEIVAEVSNGQDVLDMIKQSQPDVVCMDINMPDLNGVEATRQLHTAHPKIKIIGLSSHIDPYLAARMIDAGAIAYVDKASAGNDLPLAIQQARQNRLFLSPALGVRDGTELAQYIDNPHLPADFGK